MEKGKPLYEKSPQLPSFEPMRKNEWYALNASKPLLDLETNRLSHNINGAVLAAIRVPAENANGELKVIYVIDFGESDQPTAVYWVPGQGELPTLGTTNKRYAVAPANYRPDDDHPFAIGELFPGGDISIGRDESLAGYALGFNTDKEENRSISRKHITIRVSDDEKNISIMDMSSNGTDIWLPTESAADEKQESTLKRIRSTLGRRAASSR